MENQMMMNQMMTMMMMMKCLDYFGDGDDGEDDVFAFASSAVVVDVDVVSGVVCGVDVVGDDVDVVVSRGASSFPPTPTAARSR